MTGSSVPPLATDLAGDARGSACPMSKESRLERVSGLADLLDMPAEDDAVLDAEEEGDGDEGEEKTELSTRFTLSRDASFLSSVRNREGFFGVVAVAGRGRKSCGTKPAGSRVM